MAIRGIKGRKKTFTEQAIVRFPDGTKARIQKAVGPAKEMADLRAAVERELQHTEADEGLRYFFCGDAGARRASLYHSPDGVIVSQDD
jgi:hypothetical protein